MVGQTTISNLSVADAIQMRSDADKLLKRLLAEREVSEERCNENGMRDPIKQVTGASAMDVAVEETRQMIERLDALLAERAEDAANEERPIVATIAQKLPSAPAKATMGVAR
ncbi:MAG: hypothetical protein JSV91_12145 [Phycisphaerales bacterium]|nr:MAG: hypothetical protein JSV91_12145 [Phycisphaerales bacterium]